MSRGFVSNPEWVREILVSDEVAGIVESLGGKVLDRAIQNGEQIADTGDFAKSISGELRRDRHGVPFYRVESDDSGALSIEFGNSKDHPHRALGRAILEAFDD